ncbi:ABC transporter substrate-binding protein [Streptomyces sp. CBMA156]|uniref:ABC transporter substrate-binding protein n=1 Tax=Streptomyces sp. CBMA156 TaxID=1930280 RepID=UPI0016620CCE|nr:ABC transporter substrate-binding protein [Streptomyces sp. CBMA156]MBD0674174.1 hypothetical protein [Streptomyces sp. CBMA156]
MTHHHSAPANPSRSPRISTADQTGRFGGPAAPRPHTDAELAAVIGLLTSGRPRVETVVIGHGRDDVSRATARAFAEAWQARGGAVLGQVDWPEDAASWLRPARRLTAQIPDAWVIAAAVLGFAQLARRLRHSTDFDPARTVAFAALDDPRLPALAGPGTLDGLRGATADGGTWDIHDGWITSRQRTEPSG